MRFRTSIVSVSLMLAGSAVLAAATLKAESLNGWNTYIAASERRIARELAAGAPFLGLAFAKDGGADLREVGAGKVVIREVEAKDDRGTSIDMPDALVHDWRGAVLIPRASLDDVFAWVARGIIDTGQEDVLSSSLIE